MLKNFLANSKIKLLLKSKITTDQLPICASEVVEVVHKVFANVDFPVWIRNLILKHKLI